MGYNLDDMLEGLTKSRQMFLRHLEGLREDQWDWQPYPQCMSIRQTLRHLIVDDRTALESLRTGLDIDYGQWGETEEEISRLLELLRDSHQNLLDYLRANFADAAPETEICAWGTWRKLPQGIAHFSSEDYYHTGQVSFIRMASDPEWDYYAAIYGASESNA